MEETGRVSIARLKANFARKFPNSPLVPILLSLSDEIEGEELIGAVGVWLNILDITTHNNLEGGNI